MAAYTKRHRLDYGGKYARRAGSYLGEGLGSLIPVEGAGAVGGWLGGKLGDLFHMITGVGDYKTLGPGLPQIRKNYVMGLGVNSADFTNGPYFGSLGQDTFVTRNEYVGDIYSSEAFASTTFVLQPGDRKSYP